MVNLTFEKLKDILSQQFDTNKSVKSPRLKTLAEFINETFPMFKAEIVEGYCNTDRVSGRFRVPGKGRKGNRLIVTALETYKDRNFFTRLPVEYPAGTVAFDHNAAETYRNNYEVISWIINAAKVNGLVESS